MKEGTMVYYIDENQIHSGRVTDIEYTGHGYLFSIDSYGDCSGQYRIASSQLGKTVFCREQEAQKAIEDSHRGSAYE